MGAPISLGGKPENTKSNEKKKDSPKGPPPKGWKAFAAWQKGLVFLSLLLMAGGIALGFVQPGAEPAPLAGQGQTDSALIGQGVTGLTSQIPGQPADPNPQDQVLEDGSNPWSPALFRMGFSFFIAFAIGYAARTFLKISVIGLGFFALALFGLEYGGFITVDWGAFQDKYDTFADWLGGQTEDFTAFITGYLPSTAAATTGLVTGLRRKG
ncbi:MAG: FUN14 domain-containing protein [Planctomycetota bacterium]